MDEEQTEFRAGVPGWDWRELPVIALGGAIGALLRAGLGEAFPAGPGEWPWVTFAVNLAGAFALGYLVTRLQERLPLSTCRRPLLGTGLCGGLTTFSTMQVELMGMLDTHAFGLAAGYLAASVIFGFIAVYVSTMMVRRRLPGTDL